jgi:hypothetical protein
MATFPRYNSKANLSTDAPSVNAASDTSGQMIEQAAKTVQSVQDTAIKWSNAVDTIQKTTASANFKMGMLDIKNRAENDPSYNNSEQYFKEIEKLKTDNLKGFSSRAAEAEARMDFDYEGKVGQIQIENLYKKKMIDVGQTSMLNLIDSEISNPTPSSKQNIQKLLSQQVAAGVIDHKAAYELYNKSIKTMGEFDVANDPSTEEGQSSVLAELRKGENGKYADTPADVRLDLIKASQQRIFNNNQTFKRDTQDSANMRSNDLIEKFAAGEATIKDIENEMAIPEESGGIKRAQLLSYQKALLSGVKGDLDRMLQEKTPDHKDPTQRSKAVRSYLDLVDDFIDNKSDQWKAKEMLATAYEDGIINSKEQKFLNSLKQNMKDLEFNRNTSPVAKAIKGLKEFLHVQANASDEDIARNIKTLVGDISFGTTPDEALRKILQKEVRERIPDISSYPKTGKLKRDGNGNIIRVFPDGTYTDESNSKAAK